MSQPIASFVVRFHASLEEGEEDQRYRIKVTHVQNEVEMTFESFDQAMNYMKNSLDGVEIKEL
ncbi:hypothetical protein [Pontibacillus marinus]|uniref:Uncharacterized protein n=1 Tax=Pontibacillus marinus BH030004 = DSM 16465 TaxID=1385511 RepID=A0A0A5G423_9BACI|nr:hypothetical protein [Pontibacillus marinus]KGX87871.1 hypothetical protein N783_09230 [Pontibacillus marinus BH030004 = DSM 16465]